MRRETEPDAIVFESVLAARGLTLTVDEALLLRMSLANAFLAGATGALRDMSALRAEQTEPQPIKPSPMVRETRP